MLGTNKLVVNQATMKMIVQEWLERELVNCRIDVSHISQTSDGTFSIQTSEKEVISKLLTEDI